MAETNVQAFSGDVQIRGTTFIKANTNTNNLAIGTQAGETSQGTDTVAVGNQAGETSQGNSAVAIGYQAGETSQSGSSVAVGRLAGQSNQDINSVAVGGEAGRTDQGQYATAVGYETGLTDQGNFSTAVGSAAGKTSQAGGAVAVGRKAGETSQGASSVAIGNQAGTTNQPDNSIILNATGSAFNPTTASSFNVKPVRGGNFAASALAYTADGEIVEETGTHFDANGNFGIGTTNPTGVNGGNRLEGSSTTGFEYIATRDDTTSSAGDFIGAYLFKNTDTNGTEPHYAGIAAKDPATFGNMDLHFYSGRNNYEGDTPQMTIDEDGRVGIGTVSPDVKFQVEGTSVSTQELVKLATYYVRHHRSDDAFQNLFYYNVSDGQAFFDNRANFLYVQIPAFSGETLYTHSIGTYNSTYFQARLRDPNGVKPQLSTNTDYTIHVYSKRVDSFGNITTRGNVGIGTTNPGATLDVRGSANDPSTPTVHIGDNATDQGDYGMVNLVRHPTNGGSKAHLAFIRNGNIVFGQGFYNNTNTFGFWPAFSTVTNIPTMCFDPSGNVGIGRTDPDCNLEIYGSTSTIKITRAANGLNFGTTLDFALLNSVNEKFTYGRITGGIADRTDGAENGFLSLQVGTNGNLRSNYEEEKMRILSNGNVGIGAGSPATQLEIRGQTTSSIPTIRLTNTAPGNAVQDLGGLEVYSVDGGGDFCGSIIVRRDNTGAAPDGNIVFRTGQNGVSSDRMIIKENGNVGINDNTPSYRLDVSGEIRGTGRIHADAGVDLPATYGYCAIRAGTGDGASYSIHNSIYRTWWSIGVRDYNNDCRILFDARQGDILGTGTVASTSDDRIKINEKRITRAMDTISKLDPQLYHKTNKSSILPKEGEDVLYQTESGLIAQDIWYDAPELRHLVKLGNGADPAIEKPYRNPDITIDPDYSGWGPEPSTVNYVGLIPYLIKSVQEIATELPNVKTCVSNVNVSNVDNYHGLIVSVNKPDIYISTSSYDTKCYGVVSEENVDTINNEILINTSRDGKIWVIDCENLQSGDYITTSNVSGYGMKQSDDLVHNYTVAKILQDCDFNPTQVPVKRVARETRDVTYYVKREYSDVPQDGSEAYIHDNKIVEIDEVYYTKSTLVEVQADEDYTSRTFTPEITEEAYDTLDESDREGYMVKYLKPKIKDIRFEEYESLSASEKEEYEQMTRRVRKIMKLIETKDPLPGYEIETRTEEVDVLDSNGQLVWEETSETRVSYTTKYIDSAGVETDEANAVHKAALVNCKVML